MELFKEKNVNNITLVIFLGIVTVLMAFLILPHLLSAEQLTGIKNMSIIFLLEYPIMLFFGWIPCLQLLFNGNLLAIVIVFVCFLPIFLLRWRLPDGAKKMLYYVPLICLMMGWIYCYPLFKPEDEVFYYCFPFYLCFVPALIGLTLGMMVKHQ